MPLTDEPLTVSRVNQAVGAALAEAFPEPFWVTGEVHGYERDASRAGGRRWGQVYFELVEKEPGADAAKASVKMLAWGDAHKRVMDKLGNVPLTDGLQVKLLCAVDFYWPRASLQLKVLDADPDFTLGGMERAKRELLEKLKAEGLYDRNRSVPLPLVPLAVGLVTAEGSAAYHDFMHELSSSKYGFSVRLVDARMQGEETEGHVTAALRLLEKDGVDVIVLARGGGSRSDLMWFDKEAIARAVASCAKPVVTGIGHEIDLSVADLVAHRAEKTPTAAARFLVDRVRAFEEGIEGAAVRLAEAARRRADAAARGLGESVLRWRHAALARLQEAGASLSAAGGALASEGRRHVALRRERLAGAGPRLGRASAARLAAWSQRLDAHGRELGLKDPRRLLERGYSLLYAAGRLVKSVEGLKPGAALEARLADGAVEAAVTAVRKERS